MKWSLLSKSSGFEFDETIADILAVPAKGEDKLLDRVRKAGGDDEALYAVAAFARVRESLPAAVRKAIDKKVLADVDEDAIDGGSDEDAEDELATKRNKKAQLAKGDTVTKRTTEDVLAEAERIQKADDAKAGQRIEEAASQLRKADPKLSKAQSIVQVVKADPQLYDANTRHLARRQYEQLGYTEPSPGEIAKSRDTETRLDAAASELRKADPKLTEPQSIAKALANDSTLYEGN